MFLFQASEQGRPPEHTSKFYAKGALQYLVPILTQTLTKQVCYTVSLKSIQNSFIKHLLGPSLIAMLVDVKIL